MNTDILQKIQDSKSRLLVVTKYLDTEKTNEVIDFMGNNFPEIVEGFGENRVASLKEKNIPREMCHFIGNIQTKEIKIITKHCSVIHSVYTEKHLKKIEEICAKQGNWVEVFFQIHVDETKESGMIIEDIPKMLDIVGDMENVSLIGFSAIGKSECSREEKEAEFDLLLELRNKHLQNGFVSAGTSLDYEIALEKGVDVVRVGRGLYG